MSLIVLVCPVASSEREVERGTRVRLRPEPPFEFGMSLRTWYDGRECLLVDVTDGELSRAVELGSQAGVLRVREDDGELVAEFSEPVAEELLVECLLHLFSLEWERAEFADSAGGELAPLKEELRGLSLVRFGSRWEAVVACVLSQQLSLEAALSIRNELARRYGEAVRAGGSEHHLLPQPERFIGLAEGGLRNAGMSRSKVEYLKGIAESITAGEFPEKSDLPGLDRDEAVDVLTEFRGIGPWSADYLLVRYYGHPDGFPAADAGLQRALAKLLREDPANVDSTRAERFAERYTGHRSQLTTWLWTMNSLQ